MIAAMAPRTDGRPYVRRCKRCGRWWAAKSKDPVRCGKCKSPYWRRSRRGRAKR